MVARHVKQNTGQSLGASHPRNVAVGLFARLPRELRNRIYAFCLQGAYDNEVIVRRAALGQPHRFAHLIRESCGQFSYQWVEDPVTACLGTRSLGYDVGREMLECYYWTRTFKFSHPELCLLGPFLQTDGFGFGMIPAHYARRLQIQIQPLYLTFLLPEERALEEQQCCRAIETLSAIQTTRTEVAIEIDLSQGSLNDADYERFSDVAATFTAKVKKEVDNLKGAGLHITLAAVGY